MLFTIHDENTTSPTREPSLTLLTPDPNDTNPNIPVYLPHNLTAQEFLSLFPNPNDPSSEPAFTFPALSSWFSNLLDTLFLQNHTNHPFHKRPYKLRQLDVQAVDWFWRDKPNKEDKLGFMKIQAKIETDPYIHSGEDKERADWLPGAVFLRGGSVGVLIILQPADATGPQEKQVLFTLQPRIAASSLSFTEIPAGMLDGSTLTGSAAAELKEEAGLVVKEADLLNMSELVASLDSDDNAAADDARKSSFGYSEKKESMQQAVYPSPGATDEFIPLFLCQKRLTRRHMQWLKGKATGLRDEGENIVLKLVPLERAWREGARDGKALAALALYEGLVREGKVPGMPVEVEEEPEELREEDDEILREESSRMSRH